MSINIVSVVWHKWEIYHDYRYASLFWKKKIINPKQFHTLFVFRVTPLLNSFRFLFLKKIKKDVEILVPWLSVLVYNTR